jgi:hypothetical protein
MIFILAQGRGHFAAPYDSTQGVPGIVFVSILDYYPDLSHSHGMGIPRQDL